MSARCGWLAVLAANDAAGAGERSEHGPAAAGAASPRAVTRGESPEAAHQPQAAKVDWLNATFRAPAMSPEAFVALLGRMLGRPVSAIAGHGMLGFETTYKLTAHHGSERSAIGCIALGGESQMGRWLLQLTGSGCGFVHDWLGMAALLDDLDARVTRLDLAVDFLDGQHTVDDAVAVYQMGGFTGAGRPPSTSLAGDWLGGELGRTLYVGKSRNGKMLRVYEKGRQLGAPESEWVRYEVQFGNKDRVIPTAALIERDAFFAGAYPALADMLQDGAKSIATDQVAGEVSLAHLLHHLKRSFGKVLATAERHFGATPADLVQELRVIGLPKRVNPSSVGAGVTWEGVCSRLREKETMS